MTSVEEDLSSLTNEELSERLKSLGESHGPITRSTRQLYERRLKKRLVLRSAANCTISYSVAAQNNNATSDGSATSDNGATSAKQTPEKRERKCDIVENGDSADSHGPFYGVKLSSNASPSTGPCVFRDKANAMRLMKENPGSRFKVFQSRSEAEVFSQASDEPLAKQAKISSSKVEPILRPVAAEGSSYKSIKPDEVARLREALKDERLDDVQSLVWENPRHLIGSGDNPTIFQEGYRYNAMHICAFNNKVESAKLIMQTIENPEFMKKMYPDDTEEIRQRRIEFIADMYLNTQEKGNLETPLHFACKFGYIELVKFLARHPKIDIEVKNKDKQTARDIACSRYKMQTPSAKIVQKKLYELLEAQFYVPLLRSSNNDCPAKVIKPWSPKVLTTTGQEETEICHDRLPVPPFGSRSAMDYSFGCSSPKESPMSVKAYAGPMSKTEAQQFHEKWLMSPRGLSRSVLGKYSHIRRSDVNKGLERIGRELAKEMQVPWREYWDFLQTSVDLATEEGFQRLEDHLSQRKNAVTEEFTRRREAELETERDLEICSMFGRLHLSDGGAGSEEKVSRGHRQVTGTRNHLQQIGLFLDRNSGHGKNPASSADDRNSAEEELNEFSRSAATAAATEDESSAAVDAEPDEEESSSDDDSDRSSRCSFYTAADDLDLEYSECSDIMDESLTALSPSLSSVKVFMMGEEPSKTDADVLRAVEAASVCPAKYPLLNEWKSQVLSYPEDIRNRWTEFGVKLQLHSTPKPGSGAGGRMTSTPERHSLSFDDEDTLEDDNDKSSSSSPSSSGSERHSVRVNMFSRGSFE